jgi:hypothetical protein
MPFTSYAELLTKIAEYLPHDDANTDVAADLVTLAEARFNREIRVRQMTAVQAATAIPAGGVLALPSDFIEIMAHQLQTDPVRVPKYLPPNEFMGSSYNIAGGTPYAYTIIGDDIHFLPAPDSTSLEYLLYYYQRIPALTDINTSNWLLVWAPDLYLYGSLLEGESYFINDARMQTWASVYDRGKDSLHASDARGRYRTGGAATPRLVGIV